MNWNPSRGIWASGLFLEVGFPYSSNACPFFCHRTYGRLQLGKRAVRVSWHYSNRISSVIGIDESYTISTLRWSNSPIFRNPYRNGLSTRRRAEPRKNLVPTGFRRKGRLVVSGFTERSSEIRGCGQAGSEHLKRVLDRHTVAGHAGHTPSPVNHILSRVPAAKQTRAMLRYLRSPLRQLRRTIAGENTDFHFHSKTRKTIQED